MELLGTAGTARHCFWAKHPRCPAQQAGFLPGLSQPLVGAIQLQENRTGSFHEHPLAVAPSTALQLFTAFMILAVITKRLFWVSSDKDFPFLSMAGGSAAVEAPRSAQGYGQCSCLRSQQAAVLLLWLPSLWGNYQALKTVPLITALSVEQTT